MWIRLEDDELKLILKSIPDGPLAEKLRTPADPETAAFSAAVETDDELEVDEDAVISRGDEGAFVMSWVWVTNEQAGVVPIEDENSREGHRI